MSRFMRNGVMARLGAIMAVGLGISMWQEGGSAFESVREQLGLGGEAKPILVIFVADARAVARVRAAVSEDRVVAEGPGAFALREGRILADGHDAAGEMVSAAGWIDRELKLLRIRKKATPSQKSAAGPGQGGLRDGELAELLSKDTLTYAEATRLLDHI